MENSIFPKTDDVLIQTETQQTMLVCNIDSTITSIDNLSKEIKSAEDNIKKAIYEAKKAQDDGVKLFRKKAAIEVLQTVTVTQSEALESSIKASKSLFENQQRIAQAVKNLYIICAGNLATTRTAIKELRMRLENATNEELSEIAQQELHAAILHLKAQEDFMVRISNIENILREHRAELSGLNDNIVDIQADFITKITQLDASLQQHNYELRDTTEKINKIQNELRRIKNDITIPLQTETQTIKSYTKTFFDSTFYKIAIGVIAITAIALSLI
jgi:chromosome segregation ATPase